MEKPIRTSMNIDAPNLPPQLGPYKRRMGRINSRAQSEANSREGRVRKAVMEIDYDNGFKRSVVDKQRKAYYFDIWDTCYRMQEELAKRQAKISWRS